MQVTAGKAAAEQVTTLSTQLSTTRRDLEAAATATEELGRERVTFLLLTQHCHFDVSFSSCRTPMPSYVPMSSTDDMVKAVVLSAVMLGIECSTVAHMTAGANRRPRAAPGAVSAGVGVGVDAVGGPGGPSAASRGRAGGSRRRASSRRGFRVPIHKVQGWGRSKVDGHI